MKDRFYTLGLTWSAVYLLDSNRPALFESGFSCAAKMYLDAIRSVLDKRQPEFLFLTHVHWDHCGAAGYLKRSFPALKIAASGRAAEIVKRPNARALMRRLSEGAAPLVASIPGIDATQVLENAFQPFDVDIVLVDGQVMELGDGLTVEVLATPGHTRDHLSYYIPQRKILIGTEATGCMDRTGNIITEFLIDFNDYVASLKRLSSLPVDILCQGHHFVYVGREEVERFFARSIAEAERYRDRVCELLDAADGSVEEVVRQIKAEQWDTNTNTKQTEEAYLINLTAQVTHFAEKREKNGEL